MQRRTLLKQFVYISAGVVLLPSCGQQGKKESVIFNNLDISADQENTLASIANILIPETTTAGAKSISAHLFALMMVNDCRTETERNRFIKGLTAFEEIAKNEAGASFSQLQESRQIKLLEDINAGKAGNEDLLYFYRQFKSLLIMAYTSSQYYLTQVQLYKLVPGPFKGCLPVSAA
jgi:hypothetical protein